MDHQQVGEVLLPGVEVTIGGKVYVAPKLNLRGVRVILALASGPAGGFAGATVDAATNLAYGVEVLAASLSRNYRGLTVEAIEDELEADELNGLLAAVPKILELSGLVQKKD